MTKQAYMAAMRAALLAKYSWASADELKLDSFMESVRRTIYGEPGRHALLCGKGAGPGTAARALGLAIPAPGQPWVIVEDDSVTGPFLSAGDAGEFADAHGIELDDDSDAFLFQFDSPASRAEAG